MIGSSAPPELAAPDAEHPAPAVADAPPSDDETLAALEREALSGFPSREEAHLYLRLQRFSFCLDRYAARRAGAPPSPETDGEDPVTRIGREIAALDAYVAERFPDEDLPITLLRRRFALDD